MPGRTKFSTVHLSPTTVVTVPLFAVREFDFKFIRTDQLRRKHNQNEQAIRAAIRQIILKLSLNVIPATRLEMTKLKLKQVIGQRAPSCSLLSGLDMIALLESLDHPTPVNELRECLRKLAAAGGVAGLANGGGGDLGVLDPDPMPGPAGYSTQAGPRSPGASEPAASPSDNDNCSEGDDSPEGDESLSVSPQSAASPAPADASDAAADAMSDAVSAPEWEKRDDCSPHSAKVGLPSGPAEDEETPLLVRARSSGRKRKKPRQFGPSEETAGEGEDEARESSRSAPPSRRPSSEDAWRGVGRKRKLRSKEVADDSEEEHLRRRSSPHIFRHLYQQSPLAALPAALQLHLLQKHGAAWQLARTPEEESSIAGSGSVSPAANPSSQLGRAPLGGLSLAATLGPLLGRSLSAPQAHLNSGLHRRPSLPPLAPLRRTSLGAGPVSSVLGVGGGSHGGLAEQRQSSPQASLVSDSGSGIRRLVRAILSAEHAAALGSDAVPLGSSLSSSTPLNTPMAGPLSSVSSPRHLPFGSLLTAGVSRPPSAPESFFSKNLMFRASGGTLEERKEAGAARPGQTSGPGSARFLAAQRDTFPAAAAAEPASHAPGSSASASSSEASSPEVSSEISTTASSPLGAEAEPGSDSNLSFEPPLDPRRGSLSGSGAASELDSSLRAGYFPKGTETRRKRPRAVSCGAPSKNSQGAGEGREAEADPALATPEQSPRSVAPRRPGVPVPLLSALMSPPASARPQSPATPSRAFASPLSSRRALLESPHRISPDPALLSPQRVPGALLSPPNTPGHLRGSLASLGMESPIRNAEFLHNHLESPTTKLLPVAFLRFIGLEEDSAAPAPAPSSPEAFPACG